MINPYINAFDKPSNLTSTHLVALYIFKIFYQVLNSRESEMSTHGKEEFIVYNCISLVY